MKRKRKETAARTERRTLRSLVMSDDAHREWLKSLFRSLDAGAGSLERLVASRRRLRVNRAGIPGLLPVP